MKRTALGSAPSTLVRAPRFIERSLTVGALISVPGVVLVAVGVIVGEVVGTLLASLGTILISVALLSVVYDAFLKDVLLGDVYAAIGIQENIRALDLRLLVETDQLNLEEVLVEASVVTAIPLDPVAWSRSDWRRLLNHAADKETQVAVYLPNHDSPHIDALAERLQMDRDQLAGQIADLPDDLAKSWDEKQGSIGASRLKVYLYGTVPLVGLLITDTQIVLEIPPSLSHTRTDHRTLALVFGRRGTLPLIERFVDDQIIESRVPGFSESVMRPLKGSVTPDPDEPELQRRPTHSTDPSEEEQQSQ